MKKIVSFLLVLMICFSITSNVRVKKAEAVAIVGGYGIVQIIGMLLGGASLIGTGVVVGDLADDPENNNAFTDWVKNEYVEYMRKYQQLPGAPDPEPDKLTPMESTALLSLLTEQGIRIGSDVYDMFKSFFGTQVSEDNIPDTYFPSVQTLSSGGRYTPTNLGFRVVWQNSKYVWLVNSIDGDLIRKINLVDSDDWFYLVGNLGQSTNGTEYKLITRDNQVINAPRSTDNEFIINYVGNDIWTFKIRNAVTLEEYGTITYDPNNTYSPGTLIPDFIIPDNIIEPDDFTEQFKNIDMSPLSGLVKSPHEMIDIINGDKVVSPTLYEKIKKGWNEIYENYLKNPNLVGSPDEPLTPNVNGSTGLIDFNNLPDEPVVDPDNMPDELSALNKALFWLKGIWQSIRDLPKNIANEIGNIFQYLKNFIERFWQTFTEWWENNFLYHWTLFIEWLHTLPNLIANALTPLFDLLLIPLNAIVSIGNNIFEFLIDLPGMLIDLLKDLFIWLFVPDPEFLKDKVDIFKENFTFIDSFKQFILLFDDMTSQNRVPTITLDFSKFNGSLGGQSISMGGQAYVLDMRFYDDFRVLGDIMITAFVYLMFAWRFFSRLPEIISGGGLLYTADNKTNDIINKLEGKKK